MRFFQKKAPRVQVFEKYRNKIDQESISTDGIKTSFEPQKIDVQLVQKAHSIKEIGVVECQRISNIIEILNSPHIIKELNDLESILLLKVVTIENFEELTASEYDVLSQKCSNKAIIIFLTSKDNASFLIYWKSQELKNFLILKHYKDQFSIDDKSLYKFAARFLMDSLSKGSIGILKGLSLHNSLNKIHFHLLADHRNYNLLLLAAESGNVDVVKNLLKYGLSTESSDEKVNAQTLAWEGRHFKVILELLLANLTYPHAIDISECSEEIKHFHKIGKELHEMIKAKNFEMVEEIIKKNPNKRYFYNAFNESAAKIALDSNSDEMYEILISHNIFFAPHEYKEGILEELDYDKQRTLREIHNKHSKDLPEKHINVLLSNSFVGHDVSDTNDKLDHVYRAYKYLNEDPFLKLVLRTVAASKKIRIIYDFNRDSVNVADPTVDPLTQGLFYLSGRIYIGAKNLLNEENKSEAYATLAHELCHYAMDLVYNNNANPYEKDDHDTKKEFEKISKICEGNSGKEDVIDLVYECYPPEAFHAELIVRYPHLIALYRNDPEKLAIIREMFIKLFMFFENKIAQEMEKAIPEIELRDEIEAMKKDKKISKLKRISIFTIVSAVVGTILTAVIVWMIFYKPVYIFGNLPLENQLKVGNGPVNYKNISIKFSDLFPRGSIAYQNLTSDHISQLLKGEELNFDDPHLAYLVKLISLSWVNLAQKLKNKVLNSSFLFQNHKIKFVNIYQKNSNLFYKLTPEQLNYILDGNELSIGRVIKSTVDYFIDRRFMVDDLKLEYDDYKIQHANMSTENDTVPYVDFAYFFSTKKYNTIDTCDQIVEEVSKNLYLYPITKYKVRSNDSLFCESLHHNFSDIIESSEKTKIFVLSSEAGAGKTIVFENLALKIKEMFATQWVSLVDLKDHTKLYNISVNQENIGSFLEQILDINQDSEFEKALFHKLFENFEVIMLWNGFDEISPKYEKNVLQFLEYIHKNTKNTQYVCTRPLYMKPLEKTLSTRAYKFVPFTTDEQKEYLRKYFEFKNAESDKIDSYIEKVQNVTQIVAGKGPKDLSGRDFNTPLMLRLFAEIYEDEQLFETLNFYEIYKKFVQKKIQIWQDKSEFARDFVTKLLAANSKFNIIEVYHKFSLINELPSLNIELFFQIKYKKLKVLNLEIPLELSYSEISRMGILYINTDTEFEFAHKTFAEFFIAQYFIDNIYNADYDLLEDEAELRLTIFVYMVVRGDFTSVSTDFLKSYLESQTPNPNDAMSPAIADIMLKSKDYLLHVIDFRFPGVLELLLEFCKKDHELMLKMLQTNEDETFYTKLFNPIHFMKTNPEEVKTYVQKYITNDEFKKLINGKHQKGKVLFGMACYQKAGISKVHHEYSPKALKYDITYVSNFFDEIKQELTIQEQKELFLTAINPKTYRMIGLNMTDYENLWEVSNDLLTHEEKVDAITNALHGCIYKDTLDFLQPAYIQYVLEFKFKEFDTDGLMKFLLKKSEEILSGDEIFDTFLSKNILHYTAINNKRMKYLWNFFENSTKFEQQKQVLLHKDDGFYIDKYYKTTPFNIFQRSLFGNDPECFEFVKGLYARYFTISEIQKLVLETNEYILYVLADSEINTFEPLASYFEEIFKGKENLLRTFFSKKVSPTKHKLLEFFKGTDAEQTVEQRLQVFSKLYNN